MSKYKDFEIMSIYSRAVKLLLVASILLFSFFYKNSSYALGFILGGIACLINFNLLVKSLEGMLNNVTYSRAFFNGHFLLRFAVVIAVLVSAILFESVNLLTTVIGILIIRIVLIWEAIIKHMESIKNPE